MPMSLPIVKKDTRSQEIWIIIYKEQVPTRYYLGGWGGVSLLGAQMKIKDCATAICHLLGTAFLFSKERKTGGGEAAAPFLKCHFLFIFTSPQSDSLSSK